MAARRFLSTDGDITIRSKCVAASSASRREMVPIRSFAGAHVRKTAPRDGLGLLVAVPGPHPASFAGGGTHDRGAWAGQLTAPRASPVATSASIRRRIGSVCVTPAPRTRHVTRPTYV